MRLIQPEARFRGERVLLRLAALADCTPTYVGWLQDPEVSQFLETRWSQQTLSSVRSFVDAMLSSTDSYLFAIEFENVHVGNLKIGPIHRHHHFADLSYFIGKRELWGRGIATDAIRTATRVGFEVLKVHRMQAGLYASNVGSGRALEKVGYRLEGNFRAQLSLRPGVWEDHLWYGLLAEDWKK